MIPLVLVLRERAPALPAASSQHERWLKRREKRNGEKVPGDSESLYVELEEHDVAVLNDVILAFHSIQALFARGGN